MGVASFDDRAATYSNHKWHIRYAHRLVELSGLKSGDRVLDAATGTGLAATAALAIVAPQGSVIGVDLSAAMLERAALNNYNDGHRSVQFVNADATHLPQFEDSEFDVVICSAGLLYMSAQHALSEWHRILKPNGIVSFSTMEAGSPPGARIFRECAANFDLCLTDPSEALGSAERCLAALADSGFRVRAIVREQISFTDDDLDHAWEANLRSPGHEKVRQLATAMLSDLREHFETTLRACLARDPSTYDAHVLYASGIR
jgi:ubiquinone/menaquinone biosynthesis C-methylase UbiE